MHVAEVVQERSLPPLASSAAQARQLVRETLESAGAAHWADDAELVVSELVTNALVHAATEVRLQVRVDRSGVRVEVRDGSGHLPVRRDYSTASGTGRGLALVADLAHEWGAFADHDGKVVWFQMRASTGARPSVGRSGAAAPQAGDCVTVELLNFPLLMHAAWQEHAAALLREFLLVQLDEDDPRSFEQHAQASDAMNVLYEQVPVPDLGQQPEAIMTRALEPRVSAARLSLAVPETSVPHFAALNALLSQATALAEQGMLLVPPSQQEISEMREWICSQVRDQSTRAGNAAPAPWSSVTVPSRQAELSLDPGWDPHEINGSDRARLAMDERSIIVAVSRSTAQFLGYHDADDLLGHRIIRIVPVRYHQAHIAGTTLHMTNGRSPLLSRRVTVPVLRADGTEVLTTLMVEPRLLPGGHRLFIAEFFIAGSPPEESGA